MKPAFHSIAYNVEVADLLRRYRSGESAIAEIDRLVRLGAAIILHRFWGRLSAAAAGQGTSVEQQALSHLAGLFAESPTGSPLKQALADYEELDDLDLFLRFRSIVVRYARQELFHRWRDSDPAGAKLWRSLKRAIKLDSRLTAFPIDRPEWVALAGDDDLHSQGMPIALSDLEHVLSEVARENNHLAEVTYAVLGDIDGRKSYQKAVRIDLLFQALRNRVNQTAIEEIEHFQRSRIHDPLIKIAVEKTVCAVRDEIDQKLQRLSHLKRLSPEWIDIVAKALYDVIDDLPDGGPAQSYYDYVRRHDPDLSLTYYRENLRTRFEYLADSAQQQFNLKIKKELFE